MDQPVLCPAQKVFQGAANTLADHLVFAPCPTSERLLIERPHKAATGQHAMATSSTALQAIESSTDSGYGTAPSRRPSEVKLGLVRPLKARCAEEENGTRHASSQIVYFEPEQMTEPVTSLAKPTRTHKRWSSLSQASSTRKGHVQSAEHSMASSSSGSQDVTTVLKTEASKPSSPQRAASLFGQRRPSRHMTSLDQVVENGHDRKRVWHWPRHEARSVSRSSQRHERDLSPADEASYDSTVVSHNGRMGSPTIAGSPILARSNCSHRSRIDRDVVHSLREPRPVKVRHKDKSAKDCNFSSLYLAQEIDLTDASRQLPSPGSAQDASHTASSVNGTDRRTAQRVMRFSLDGRYLAIGGQDGVIRVFAVLDTPEKRENVLLQSPASSKQSTPDVSPLKVGGMPKIAKEAGPRNKTCPRRSTSTLASSANGLTPIPVFSNEPVKEFRGHSNEVLDLSWSKNGFLLSASMDKTARIWHLSYDRCLASFVHGDFVTSAVFHPRDDRFFLSGCLDGKLRLWNVSAKKLQYSQEVQGMITACAFTSSGDTACVGLYTGSALFYSTDRLVLKSAVSFKSSKSAKGGRKITGIEPIAASPSPTSRYSDRVLITSNDSCIRVYEIASKKVVARFKSKTYSNHESQIRASLAEDNAYIVAGSEAAGPGASDSGHVVIWNCASILAPVGMGRWLLDRISQVRTSVQVDDEVPMPEAEDNALSLAKSKTHDAKSSETAVEYFAAHAGTVSCALMAPLSSSLLLVEAQDPCISETVCKVRQRHLQDTRDAEGSRARLLTAAMTAPMFALQRSSPIGKAPIDEGILLGEACQEARVIVSVDDNALLRIWRSDPYHVVTA